MKKVAGWAGAGLLLLAVGVGIAEDRRPAEAVPPANETLSEPTAQSAEPGPRTEDAGARDASTLVDTNTTVPTSPETSAVATTPRQADEQTPGIVADSPPPPPAESEARGPEIPEIPAIDRAEIEQMMTEIEALLAGLGQTMNQGDDLP